MVDDVLSIVEGDLAEGTSFTETEEVAWCKGNEYLFYRRIKNRHRYSHSKMLSF